MRSPWDAVKVEFARKAARSVLASRPFMGSDAVDELAAAALVEVCEMASRGVPPSKRMYRLATLHKARDLWRRRGNEVADDDVDERAPVAESSDAGEMRAISLHDLTRMRAHLDDRARDVLSAYLACETVTEIAERRGETFAAVDSLLSRLLRHLCDGTVPSSRGQREKPGLACLGCGVDLPVPEGRGGLPVRCKTCAAERRKAKDRERHAKAR